MPHEFLLPVLPGGAATVELWYKQPGDTVAVGDPLVLVRPERVAVDLPATEAGTLEAIKVEEGDTVDVGGQLAVLVDQTGATSDETEQRPEAAPLITPIAVRSTPLARQIAKVHGLDLASVQARGHGGRVTRADLVPLLGDAVQIPWQRPVAAPAAPANGSTPQAVVATSAPAAAPAPAAQADAVAPAAPAAEPAVFVASDGPTAVTAVEVELDGALAFAKREASRPGRGVRLSPLAVVAQAAALALVGHRTLNAAWSDDAVILRGRVNVAIEEHGQVKVVADAAALSVAGLARALERGGDQAAATFTVRSNDGHWSEARLAANQSATLTLGAARRQPTVVDGPLGEQIATRTRAILVLCYDARMLDQPEADRFLVAVKQQIEALR